MMMATATQVDKSTVQSTCGLPAGKCPTTEHLPIDDGLYWSRLPMMHQLFPNIAIETVKHP